MDFGRTDAARHGARPGGRVLADALVAQGISHVFAVPGESYLDVLDGLYAVRDKIQLVTCRFEAGAVNAAEALGKLTGRPAAAMVTRGPGACHGAIGVHIAMQDSTPLLLFVGQIPFAETDRESFQEVDYRRMFSPLAKWVTQIDGAERSGALRSFANTAATSLVLEGGRVTGVVTERGTITADHVVVCAGLWGRTVAAMAGEDLPVMPIDHPLMFFGPYAEFAGTGKDIGYPLLRDQGNSAYMRDTGDPTTSEGGMIEWG